MKVIKCIVITILILFVLAFVGMVAFTKDRVFREQKYKATAEEAFKELMKEYGLEEGDYMVTRFRQRPEAKSSFDIAYSVRGKEYLADISVSYGSYECTFFSNYYSEALKEAITDAVKKEIEKRGLFQHGEYTIDVYRYGDDLATEKLLSWIKPETFDEVIYGEVRDYRYRDPKVNIIITYYSKEENLSKDKIGKLFTEAGWSQHLEGWRCDHYVATPETCTEADLRERVSYSRGMTTGEDGISRSNVPIYEKFD